MVIPYPTDRFASAYIVIPKLGAVAPIGEMDIPEDRVNYLQGKTEKVNINTYLQNGVLHYPGSATYGENGNAVIMGHSSYFNQDRGRYKTVFQAIIGLNQGDSIWIYQKNAEGKYDRYEYIVEKSFET
jgi:sortase (surface protein transpeptidase)